MDLSSRGCQPKDRKARNHHHTVTRVFHSLYKSTSQHGFPSLPIQNIGDAETISPRRKKDPWADSECLARGLKLSGRTE